MIAKIEAGTRRVDALELARLAATLMLPLGHFLDARPVVVSRRSVRLDEETAPAGRQSYRLEAELLAWHQDVRQMMNLAVLENRQPMRYAGAVGGEDDARRAATWLRRTLEVGDGPITTLMDTCEAAGQFVLVTNLDGDGASLVDDDIAVAVVSQTGDPGRRRATAAHELGHLVLGDEYSSDLSVHLSRADREAVVDAFAAELLLPTSVIQAVSAGATLARDSLVTLAADYRTSWSLALRQAARAGVVTSQEYRRWGQRTPTRAELREAVGWAPEPDLASVRVPRGFAHAVMVAWQRKLLTTARAVELMHGQIVRDDLPVLEDLEPTP